MSEDNTLLSLPLLPVEIVDIILFENILLCLNISKRYRVIAVDKLSKEYDISEEDFTEYLSTGISPTLFIDFKCFFALNPQWKDIKDEECYEEFIEDGYNTREYIDNYLCGSIYNCTKEFSKSVCRDIYQIDIDLICLYEKIFKYLTHYCGFEVEGFFFQDIAEESWCGKEGVFGENLLIDRMVKNTEYLDITKLTKSLCNMEIEDEECTFERDQNTYWYIFKFADKFNIEEDVFADKLMKMQDFIEEKIYLEKADYGFSIKFCDNNEIFIFYGHREKLHEPIIVPKEERRIDIDIEPELHM